MRRGKGQSHRTLIIDSLLPVCPQKNKKKRTKRIEKKSLFTLIVQLVFMAAIILLMFSAGICGGESKFMSF